MKKQKIGREKDISDTIKLDSTAKTPTKADFNRKAKDGVDVNDKTNVKKKIFGDYYTSTLYPYFYLENGMSTEDYDNHKIYMDATEKFFGIDFYESANDSKKLLFEIADEAYYTGERFVGTDEADKPIYEPIQPFYDRWMTYCDFVDKIPKYVKINFPDYSHNQLRFQKQLEQSVQLYPNTIIEDIYEYLKYYSLSQHKKAKANYLSNVGLPNINKINAQKIVELLYQQEKYNEI